MNNTGVNQTKVSVKHIVVTTVGLVFIILASQIPKSTISSTTLISPGGIAFGPETFIRSTGKPAVITRNFSVANPDAEYFIQVQSGGDGMERVSSAVIKLNGKIIISPNEFNQNIPGLSENVILQENNTLKVEIRSRPIGALTITIRRAMLNPTVSNRENDLRGSNYLEGVGLTWTRDERAVEYVLFRSDSLSGPFAELSHLPAGGERRTNATDFTPGARIKTLCYKLEARDASGKTIRVYEPICVPPFVPNPHELDGLSKRITPDFFCLSDSQFTDTSTMSLDDIRNFLARQDSSLIRQIKDVDGVDIDVSAIINDVAKTSGINPQVILGTMEREQQAVTTKPGLPNESLRFIMGFDPRNIVVPFSQKSIREQIRDGIAQYRRDFDRLTAGQPTTGGWQIGVSKTTLDEVAVTPRTKVSAGMFSYDPEVGKGWGGQTQLGGNFFFCWSWAKFDFPNLVRQPATILRQFNVPVVGNGRGITFDGTNLYYTNRDDTRIFKINTDGQLLNTIQTSPPIFPRALAWDGSELWIAPSRGRFFTVNLATGVISFKFAFNYPPTDTCYSQLPGFTDGFEFDPTGNSFWISDDAGKNVYNVSKTGSTLSSFSVAPECNSGIGVSPNRLFLILYDQPDPDVTFPAGRFNHFTKAGVKLAPAFTMGGVLYEDATFDSVTFAPRCALWTVQNFLPAPPTKITAFEIPCD